MPCNEDDSRLVNAVRPGGRSGYAPLHQAAYRGDDLAALNLVGRGAWLSLRTATGERPTDVARRRGFTQLASALEPKREVPAADVLTIYLHAVIDIEALGLEMQPDRKPQVGVLADLDDDLPLWFGITGMYGGMRLSWFEDQVYAAFTTRMSFGDESSEYTISPSGVEHTKSW